MSVSTFRLPDKADRLYAGQMLDRARVVEFTLDGERFEGFHGDTVLSALLANGADTFGHYRGEPIALDERLHPPVAYAALQHDPKAALSMSRMPVADGMELVSLARIDEESAGLRARLGQRWRRLRGRLPASLSLDPETISPFPGPWTELEPERRISADLIVVGGGAGGLAAARAGAEQGWTVVLVEQLASLGGDATFFGSEDGDARASEVIGGLVGDLRSSPGVNILTHTEVLGFSGGMLRAHQTLVAGERPSSQVIALHGTRVVLAPGAHERLPLFAGNRLPGVNGARAAHRLAADYGVWRGTDAIINTASSAATQVALQAADMGVEILKLTDSRAAPHSHFFEFAKAYGVLLATGLRVSGAEMTDRRRLKVRFDLTGSGKVKSTQSETTDRLLICGGWQSDLTLWNMAGGQAGWDATRQQLRAVGEVENLALAGWCSGATSITSCIASGEQAVAHLSGARVVAAKVEAAGDRLESDDGPLPVSRPTEEYPACYLDNGFSFSILPPDKNKSGLLAAALGLGARETGLELRALSLNDVAAKVILGEITPEVAGQFAKERCVTPSQIETGVLHHQTPSKPSRRADVPEYLSGRFGAKAEIVELVPVSGQGVETGCLVFQSSSQTRPDQAIGVVVNINQDEESVVQAYVALDRLVDRTHLVARLGGRTVDMKINGKVSKD